MHVHAHVLSSAWQEHAFPSIGSGPSRTCAMHMQAARGVFCWLVSVATVHGKVSAALYGQRQNYLPLLVRGAAGAASMAANSFALKFLPLEDTVRSCTGPFPELHFACSAHNLQTLFKHVMRSAACRMIIARTSAELLTSTFQSPVCAVEHQEKQTDLSHC